MLIILGGAAHGAGHAERRAILGINIATAGPNGGPAEGVTVVGVSPGGPAAQAGIEVGDVIVSIGDVALTDGSERAANRKLLGFMESVAPGDEIKLSYLRDGKVRDARLTAGELDLTDLPQTLPFMRDLQMFGENLRSQMDGRGSSFRRGHGVFRGLELVALTEGLGEYFGTDEGLLVVRAPDEAALELRDGDVIRAIGGREPKDPAHAMRILRSYEPGEKLVLDLVRKKRSRELIVSIPERESVASP